MSKILNSLMSSDPTQEVLDLETGLPKSQVELDKQQEKLDEPLEFFGASSPMSRLEDPTGVGRTSRVDEKVFDDATIGSRKAFYGSGAPGEDFSVSGLQLDSDFVDFAAHQQSTADKWGNGLTKMVGKTVVNTIGGLGMIGTGIAGIAKWDFKSVYDNEFHNSLDDINEWMDGKLPNYAAKEEREMGFLQSMGRANFWAGDLFGNVVPFVAGAILTELALSAATAATLGGALPAQGAATAGLVAKATALLTKAARAANVVGKTAKGVKALSALRAATTGGSKLYKAGSLARRVLTGAGYEAGVEARNHINVLKSEFTTDFIEKNGRPPTDEERAEIQDRATQSANWVFAGNLALVGGGNMLQFPKIFMPGAGSLAKKPLGKIMRDSVTDPYKAAYRSWTKSRNIIDAGYNVLKNPVWEGIIEEGGQGWIDNAAHHNAAKYWARKHDPSGVEYGLGMIESLGETFQESYGTKEAWKEIGMGMLIGGLGIPMYAKTGQKTKDGKDIRKFEMQGGAFEPMRDRAAKRARTDKLADAINKNPSAYEALRNKFENYSRAVDLQVDKDGALAENDMFTYKNAENDEFFSFISTRLEAGLFNDVIEDIKLVEEMSNEQFVEEFGYTDIATKENWSDEKIDARKTKVVESALAQAEKVREATELVDSKFSGIEGWSQEEVNQAMSQFAHHLPAGQQTVENLNKVIREQLIHSAATIESVDRRHEEVSALLDEITGGALREDGANDLATQMRKGSMETFGARARAISKYLSENEKLADNDPAKLDEAAVTGLNQELGQLNAAIAAGLMDNSLDDAAVMAAFQENNPKEFAKEDKQQEVLGLLRDLRKLNARRQEFIGYYNGLFTKEGQQEALTQVEFFMDENDAKAKEAQREAAKKALREGNDKAFREATNGLEFKVESTDADGNSKVGYYKWAPNSGIELFNVKDSAEKITIDDLRQQNEDGSMNLKEGVTLLTSLQTEKRLIREAIARIKETAPEEIIETEKKVEELNAKIVDIAERLERLNLTANTKDSKGRMRAPAGTVATKGKQKGKNIGGQLVKNAEVLDAIDQATLQIENITEQRDKLKLDLELFRGQAVMLDSMLKESGEGPLVSPFQRSLEQRVALEKAIKEDGLRKLNISGTTIPYNLDEDGKPLFESEERLADRYELTEKSENSYYTTAEVLEQVSSMIAQQESNLESLVEKNEVLKEMILDDSFLSLMEQFQKDNPGADPQDPASFIAYTNQILEDGAESVTKDARKWKGKDRDYWQATAERHAKLLAAKPDVMASLYASYAEVRDAKAQANLMLDEFYATEEKISNLKQSIERDRVREARLMALEGRKAEGISKVQRSIVFGTGYTVLQNMLDSISREELAEETLLTEAPTSQQPEANSSTGDIYMDEVYSNTTTNEAGEEVPRSGPVETFENGSDPKNQDGGADNNGQFKPDASDTGYGKTAGVDKADKASDLRPAHMSPSQRTFYKFVDDLKGTFDTQKYRLRAVSVNNNPYPELTQDFVTKDPETGKAIDDIMMIVVNKDGTPVKRGGEFVFTKMLLPDPSGDRFSGIGGETGITQEAWEELTSQFESARQAVINSEGGLTFNITGSSIGMPNLQKERGEFVEGSVVGRLTNRVEDVNKIPLRVATGDSISENGVQYQFGVRRGMVYAIHKGRPVPMQLRTINATEAETVMQMLMGYGRGVYSGDPAISGAANIIPGTKNNIPVFSRLHDLIKFGQWKDKGNKHAPKYSIYLETKDNNKYLVFGDSRILLQSIDPTVQPSIDITVVDGRAEETVTEIYSPENAQLLRDFLMTKIHNVSRPTLNTNAEYYDVSIDADGVVSEVRYENYREYLMKPRDTLSDTPMSTSLVPMVPLGENGEGVNDTQFKFTYLKYDLGHYAKPAVAPATPKAPVQQASPEGGTDLANLAGQAQNISKAPQEVAGIKGTDLEVDKTYNLVVTPAGGSPIKVEVSRQSDGTIMPKDPGKNPTVTKILATVADSLKVGTPFETVITNLKAQAPNITAEFMFEELDAPVPAPISAEVKEQGQTVEEAVVEKTTQPTSEFEASIADIKRWKTEAFEKAGFEENTWPADENKEKQEEIINEYNAKLAALNQSTDVDSDYRIPELGEDPDSSPFLLASRVNESEENRANIAEELAWFEEKFPNIPISTVPGLVEGVGYGQTIEAGRVILSQLAVEGTTYHEAFHVIEGRFISAEQKDAVYAAYSRLTGVKENISEELAEEFRTYMLTDGKFPVGKGARKDQSLVQKFFQAVKDFINLLLGKGPRKDQEMLQTLFKSIKNDTFSTPNPDAKFTGEAKQFKRLELADGTFLSVVQSRDFVETIVGNMFKVMFAGDVGDISMPDLLNLSSSQHSDLLATRVNELLEKSIIGYTNNLKAIISNPDVTAKVKEKAITLLNTVGSQPNAFWGVLKQETFSWLKKYKVEMQPLEDLQDDTKKLRDSVSMVDANEVNVKQMAPAIVKLLMATLPAGTTRGGVNSVMGEGLVDSRKFFNLVMQELAGTESFQDQANKLYTLIETHPEFKKPVLHLLDRLKAGKKYPAEGLTPSEFQMQQQFRQQFHKAYSEDHMALVDADTGAIKVIRTNADRKNALMIEEFRGNLKVNIREGKGPFKELPDGAIAIDMGAKMSINGKQLTLEQYAAKPSRKDSLAFLDQFGIQFDNAETLSNTELNDIFTQLHGEGGTGIVSELIKLGTAEENIEEFYSSESGAFTRLKKIIDIQAKRTTKTIDLQHQAADGKTNYSIILNNFASNVIGRLNSGKIPSFLLDRAGQVLESVRGSLLLEGVQKGLKIGYGAISGLKIEGSRHGKVLQDVSPKRLFQTEFTTVLNGIIPLLRASEKKTEFSLNLKLADRNGNSIYQMMPKSNDAYADQMMKYLRMEIFKSKITAGDNIAGYREAKGSLRLFGYLPIDLEDIGGVAGIDTFLEENKEDIKAAIINRLDSRSEIILNEAVKHGVFSSVGEGQYRAKIEPAVLEELGIKPSSQGLIGKAEALKVARRFEMLYSVGAIEQTVSILGDVGFFNRSSFFKRTSGVAGPKKFANNSDRINNYLNEKYQREDGKIADGKFNIITLADVKGSISTDTFLEYAEGTVSPEVLAALVEYFNLSPEASKSVSVRKFLESRVGRSRAASQNIRNAEMLLDYLSYDEADAQGYITMDEYMEFMERVGDATPMMREAYAKVQAGIKLNKAEQAAFTPLKPQYYGPSSNSEIFSPIFLKLSLLPIYPQLFEATNPNGAIANMYRDMQSSKQVGISVFESGVKIGRAVDENGNSNPFYNEGGEYSPIQEGLIQELDYEYFGIQVDMGEKIKDKQVKGSQQRALLGANAYKAGEVVSGKENIVRYDLELSALENETNNTNFKYLTDELGITEDKNGNFVIEDKGITMLASLLTDEAVRREMDDAYLDGIDKFLESDTRVLDTLGNKTRIENLLYSLISNRVIRSKIRGGAKVQVASTGFEMGVRSFADVPTVYQDVHKFGSNVGALQFYRRGPKGSKTTAMQVMLPHYFKELLGENVVIRNGTIYKDGKQIGGKELLEIYGYRIPTSALNSIDAIEVVGFLPQEAGEAIMIPSEAVVKNGGDYDIDKLTLYFPNYVWNKRENRLSKVDYLTNENSTVQERVEALKRLDPKKYSLIADRLGVDGVKEQFITLSKNLRKFRKQLFKNASAPELKAIKTLEAQKAKLKPKDAGMAEIDFMLGILGSDIFKDVESIDDATQGLKESVREHEEILESFNAQIIKKLTADNAKENPSISIENQNAQKAIDNRIIELSREIVLDPTNFEQLIRPVSAFRLKELASEINKERGVSNSTPEFFDLLNFESVLSMAQRFWGGKAGLGMAAVVNTHQIKAQKAGLGIVVALGEKSILRKFNTIESRVTEDGTGFIPLGNIYDVNNENLISEMIGEFITAFVDVAKDPFVFDINANMSTFTSFVGLLRLGVPVETAARFVAQSSIKKFADKVLNDPGSTPFDLSEEVVDEFTSLAKKYKGDLSIANELMRTYEVNTLRQMLNREPAIQLLEESQKAGLSVEDALVAAGITAQDATTYYAAQAIIMSDFNTFRVEFGNPINKISAIKSDRSSGTARSRAHARLIIKEQEALFTSGNYVNLDKYIGEDSYMNSFNDVQEKGSRLFNSVFVSDRLPGGAAIVDKLIDRAVESPLPFQDKLTYVDLVENHFVTYLINTIPGLDGKAMHQDAVRLLQGKGKDVPSLPRRIKELQQKLASEGESSLILDELFPILETGDNTSATFRTEGIKRFSKRLATFDKNVLIEDMKVLLDRDPQLAEDVIKFTILQSGTMKSPISFTDLMPAENMFRIIEPLLKNYLDSDYTIDVESFEDQFVQNIFTNPVATEQYVAYKAKQGEAEALEGRSPKLGKNEVRLVVNNTRLGPHATKPMRLNKPPPLYITVKGIPQSGLSPEELAELKRKGKPKTLTRVFKLGPDVMAKWVKIQDIRAKMSREGKKFDYIKHTTVALRRAEWVEMPRKGDGMRFTEYGPKNSLSIIGENNTLLDNRDLTKETTNTELQERLQADPIRTGNILEMKGTPIIPIATEGNPAATDLARKANEKGLLSQGNRTSEFNATKKVVSAKIKNNFADPVDPIMFIAALGNIQSLAQNSPDLQFLMPPIGLGVTDGNNSDEITNKVELLSKLVADNNNITLVINDSPLVVEQAHNATLRDMFNCK